MDETAPGWPARMWSFIVRHRVTIIDLSILVAVLAVVAYLAFSVDIFVTEGGENRDDLVLELDEILALGALLAVGLLIFAVRRYTEQRRETGRRLEAEHHARELAYADPLTGLANRRQLNEALALAVAQPPTPGRAHALFLIDLNGFKQVNDVHGHSIGDELLIIVAQRLLQTGRKGDTIARFGGDEFAVLAHDLAGPEAAAAMAQRMLDALDQPIQTGSRRHSIGAGVGIALLGTDSAEEGFRRADVALYRAKTERRSAFRFFEAEMDALVQERDRIERELRQALDRGAVAPAFQPTLDLRTGELVSFEATPRWIAADGSIVPPQRFLPVAEESGLIHRIAEETLRRAATAAVEWPAHVTLAVDLFPGQLHDPAVAERILITLAETGLPAKRLEIEITESAVVRDLEAAKAVCGRLRRAGVRISLDNFGTGYSSLYHLREFQLDKVKIDRSFVDQMSGDDSGRVVAALAGLGRGLGLTVSVAGLNDAASEASALQSGIEQGQGRAFGTALTEDEAAALATAARLNQRLAS